MRRELLVMIALAVGSTAAVPQCMVSPTDKGEVSGRFGKFRDGGAANFGSGNPKPHMHDGLDFSTGGSSAPLYATAGGVVIWAKLRGSAGNTVMIRRDNGEMAVYYHLSSIAVKEGDTVAQGQVIGRAGNTGMQPSGAVHLHFIYGVKNADDARALSFSTQAAQNPTFNPGQLQSSISKKDFGYATDPSPFFCQTFPIQSDGLQAVLGADTMAQYGKLFGGGTPPMGVTPSTQFDAAQVAAANGDALQASSMGATSLAAALSDVDGYGALPAAPLGDYESLSPAEMMATEARRRFADIEWGRNVTKVSSRALWVDLARAQGVALYMENAIRLKKERVEGLMAVYTSQKMANMKARTQLARQRAERQAVAQAVN